MDYSEQEAFIRTSFDDDRDTGNLSPRGLRSRSSALPWDQRPTITTPPKTIILGLWPYARHEQLEYYVQGYETLYPTAKILLLHHSWTSTKHIDAVLSSLIGDEEKQLLHEAQQSHVLVHLFGDDAATQVCRLLRSYRLRTTQTLHVKSIILDSVPVIAAPNYKTLRRSPAQLLAFLWMCLISVFWRIASLMTFRSSEFQNTQVQHDLHNPKLLPTATKKCYIFPEDDLMFAWDTSTRDDELCQRQDFRVRRNSIDHKQQWTSNQERYWLGIENAWGGK